MLEWPSATCRLKSYDSGISTLVNYLWGISLGAFLFAFIMVLVFALPMLLQKTGTIRVRT
jgi:hypothetical protein